MKTKKMFRTSDGLNVEFSFYNRKKPETVIFINANGWCFAEWSKEIKIKRFNLLLYNCRGTGNSELGDADYVPACTKDIYEICKHLKLNKVHLVAHSLGGLIATLFYNNHKDIQVNSMTYVCCSDNDPYKTYSWRHWFTWGAKWVVDSFSDGFLYKVGQSLDKSKLAEEFANLTLHYTVIKISKPQFLRWRHAFLTSGKALKRCVNSCSRHGEAIGKMMEKIDVPTLVIGADYDFLVDPMTASRIHKRIPGSEYHMFHFSLHGPMLQQPKKFRRMLVEFLKKQGNGV
jgi:pimeloyl-ACP methyl ester carboxylesterase